MTTTDLYQDRSGWTPDPAQMAAAGKWAAHQLDTLGHARLTLTPGDMTRYDITIVAPGAHGQASYAGDGDHDWTPTIAKSYLVAISFGPMYAWSADAELHPGYVTEHWTDRRDHDDARYHEGVILCAFLNEVWHNITF